MCPWWLYSKYTSGRGRENTVYHDPEKPGILRLSGLGFGVRHVQCFMAFLGWATACSIRSSLSLAIVAMTPKLNGTWANEHPVLPWDEQMQGTILSSFFWGFMLAQFVGGQLAEKFGPKIVIGTVVFISGAITMLTPFAAIQGGYHWMIFARSLVGLMQGCLHPSLAFLLSRWAPIPERGRLVNIVLTGNTFGNIVTPAVAGILADSRWGWPSIFYVFGGAGILWALFYSYVGASSPLDHETISESEKKYILTSLPDNSPDRASMKTPWKAIATSVPVWALMFSMFCDHWGFLTLLTQIPRYINGLHGINIKDSGFLSALPFATSYVLSLVYGAINDALINREIVTRTTSKKLWNSVAQWGPALTLTLLAFAGTHTTLAVFLLVASLALDGAVFLGIFSNHMDLCPNFAGTVMGITNGLALNASIAAPLFVGYIVEDRTSLAQWRTVFLTSAAMFFVGNLSFIIFGTAEVQPWNFPSKSQESVELDPKASKKAEPADTLK